MRIVHQLGNYLTPVLVGCMLLRQMSEFEQTYWPYVALLLALGDP